MAKNYYDELDQALKSYEEFKSWHEKNVSWICDRIAWCYKWKKITEEETDELTDRICKVMDRSFKYV